MSTWAAIVFKAWQFSVNSRNKLPYFDAVRKAPISEAAEVMAAAQHAGTAKMGFVIVERKRPAAQDLPGLLNRAGLQGWKIEGKSPAI